MKSPVYSSNKLNFAGTLSESLLPEGNSATFDEIDRDLAAAGIPHDGPNAHSAEELIEWVQAQFLNAAEAANPDDVEYGTKFEVYEEFEDESIYARVTGKGEAFREPGMKGDGYLIPDDPDNVTYEVTSATLEIYPANADDEQIGEWNITNLLN